MTYPELVYRLLACLYAVAYGRYTGHSEWHTLRGRVTVHSVCPVPPIMTWSYHVITSPPIDELLWL